MAINLPQKTEKAIPGGTAILVEPSSGKEMRAAVVTIDGQYPEVGNVGINVGKTEMVFVVEGAIDVTKGDELISLNMHDILYLEAGIPYSISGKATVLVAIAPGDAPSTKIVSKDE